SVTQNAAAAAMAWPANRIRSIGLFLRVRRIETIGAALTRIAAGIVGRRYVFFFIGTSEKISTEAVSQIAAHACRRPRRRWRRIAISRPMMQKTVHGATSAGRLIR